MEHVRFHNEFSFPILNKIIENLNSKKKKPILHATNIPNIQMVNAFKANIKYKYTVRTHYTVSDINQLNNRHRCMSISNHFESSQQDYYYYYVISVCRGSSFMHEHKQSHIVFRLQGAF